MKITVAPTAHITELDGVPCRVWHGVTEDGTPVVLFVHRIAIRWDLWQEPFERELIPVIPPQMPS